MNLAHDVWILMAEHVAQDNAQKDPFHQ